MKIPAADLPKLENALNERFSDIRVRMATGELVMRVRVEDIVATLTALRDEPEFSFSQMVDLCGVDYSTFGMGYGGLFTKDAVSKDDFANTLEDWAVTRFAVVYHLSSIRHNHRLRVRVFLPESELPACPTATTIWPAANWYEREVFDLFGIVFEGHPDLRRILTDYGFIGHPFRKDFPVYGNVEMRYDPSKGRVVYQPVTIKPREVVPRIRRMDNFGNRGDG